jgi:hypothetical protein
LLSEFVYNYQSNQNPHKKLLIKEEQLAKTRKRWEDIASLSWAILYTPDRTANLIGHFLMAAPFIQGSFHHSLPSSDTNVYQNPKKNKLNLYKMFLILLRRYSLHEASSI